MAQCKEHDIIKKCKDTFASEASSETGNTSGLMMELYEFITDINDNSKTPKAGRLLRPTSMDQVNFIKGLQNKAGHIQMSDKKKKAVDAKFWIKDSGELNQMTEMVDRAFKLKHDGILKAIACAYNEQLSKVVVLCEDFDHTLQEWFALKGALAIPDVYYLSTQGKDIIRSGWTAIEYIWSMGFTCDELDKLSTYVMSDTDLKILPFVIRSQLPTDSKLVLREKFADLLNNHIAPLWKDQEFRELTGLMKCQEASFELVLGHPVLASSEERLLMYRIAYYPHMTQDQLNALKANTSVDLHWAQNAKQLDLAFRDILQGTFTPDVVGALQFAAIVSCHYDQRRKRADPSWNGQLAPNYVDLQLKRALPLMLCKRYALKTHAAFFSKAAFQL